MRKKYVPFKTRKETGRVNLDAIIYVEKNRRRTTLFTDSRAVTFYSNMDYVKQYVDERFLDCHRSYLFNMDKIILMTDQTVYMEQGYKVLLGRESFRRGRRRFDQYLAERKNGENP